MHTSSSHCFPDWLSSLKEDPKWHCLKLHPNSIHTGEERIHYIMTLSCKFLSENTSQSYSLSITLPLPKIRYHQLTLHYLEHTASTGIFPWLNPALGHENLSPLYALFDPPVCKHPTLGLSIHCSSLYSNRSATAAQVAGTQHMPSISRRATYITQINKTRWHDFYPIREKILLGSAIYPFSALHEKISNLFTLLDREINLYIPFSHLFFSTYYTMSLNILGTILFNNCMKQMFPNLTNPLLGTIFYGVAHWYTLDTHSLGQI